MTHQKALILKEEDFAKSQLIVKSNNLVEASYRLSLQEQRILFIIISMIKPEDQDFETYKIEIQNFMRLVGVTGHSKYEEMKTLTKKLRERTLVIKNLNEDTETQVGWVSSFKYFNREGYVQARLDPELKPYFLNLKERFTQYQLENIIRLKSPYSIRIYELLKQYQRIGERYFTVAAIKKTLGIQADEYKLYGHFKDRVLNRAKKEIPQKTDIRFNFKEQKEGRKVVGIYFFIKANKQDGEQEAELEPDIKDIDLYIRLQQYFLQSPTQAKEFLNKYDIGRLKANLAYVERGHKAGKIENIGAYTQKAIKENYQIQKSLFDNEAIEEKNRKRQAQALKEFKENLKPRYAELARAAGEEHKRELSRKEIKQAEEGIAEKVKEERKGNPRGLKIFVRLASEKYWAEQANFTSREEWEKEKIDKFLGSQK